MSKKLSIKQRKWVVEFLKTGNASEAAMRVYDCKDRESAASIGSENFRKLADPVRMLMEEKGISLGRLTDVLSDGLGANRVISARVIVKKDRPTSQADGELPLADGRTDDFIEVPDHTTRHKYLETAAKWLGMDPPTEKAIGVRSDGESIEVIIRDYKWEK